MKWPGVASLWLPFANFLTTKRVFASAVLTILWLEVDFLPPGNKIWHLVQQNVFCLLGELLLSGELIDKVRQD